LELVFGEKEPESQVKYDVIRIHYEGWVSSGLIYYFDNSMPLCLVDEDTRAVPAPEGLLAPYPAEILINPHNSFHPDSQKISSDFVDILGVWSGAAILRTDIWSAALPLVRAQIQLFLTTILKEL